MGIKFIRSDKYTSPWTFFISLVGMSISFVAIVLICLWLNSYINNYEVVDVDTLLSFMILISSFTFSLFFSIIYLINFSFKERHRREEALEWERSGEEITAIRETIDYLVEENKEFDERIRSNSYNYDWMLSDPRDSNLKLIESLKIRQKKLIDKLHNSYAGETKNKSIKKNRIKLLFNNLFSLRKKNKSKQKINSFQNENRWFIAGTSYVALSEYFVFNEWGNVNYNYEASGPKSLFFINPKTAKIRVYLLKDEPNVDCLSIGYHSVNKNDYTRPILLEFKSTFLSEVKSVFQNKPTFKISKTSFLSFSSHQDALGFNTGDINSFSVSEIDMLKRDINNYSIIEYDNDFLINFLNEENTENDDTKIFIAHNFIKEESVKRLRPFVGSLSKFNGLISSSITFPDDYKKMDPKYQMFLGLTNKLNFSDYPFMPNDYRVFLDEFRRLTTFDKWNNNDLLYFYNLFADDAGKVDPTEAYVKINKSIFKYLILEEQPSVVEVWLINDYEYLHYIHNGKNNEQQIIEKKTFK